MLHRNAQTTQPNDQHPINIPQPPPPQPANNNNNLNYGWDQINVLQWYFQVVNINFKSFGVPVSFDSKRTA